MTPHERMCWKVSRFIHSPSLLALCPWKLKLTSVDFTPGFTCPLFSYWAWSLGATSRVQGEGGQGVRSSGSCPAE